MAVGAVSSGVAWTTTASTIAAQLFIGTAIGAFYAVGNANWSSPEAFGESGSWGTVVGIAGSGLLNAAPAIVSTVKNSSDAIIGKKLEYVFGNATGSRHNIERSIDMENKLNSIGIYDDATGRAFMETELRKAYVNTTNGITQENGRIMKESLLAGPNGVAKMQSVWDGNKLIMVEIFKSN